MISIRKLAALDMMYHGPKLILVEFAAGVLLPVGIGLLSLLRAHSRLPFIFGIYMLMLGLNYVPLLLHAVSIALRGNPSAEITDESDGLQHFTRSYGISSLLLLVPLIVPILALMQLRDD